MLYTGIDYHKSFSYLTTMNGKGEVIIQKKLPSNGEIVSFRQVTELCCASLQLDTYYIFQVDYSETTSDLL